MGYIDYNEKTGAVEITYGGKEAPFAGIDSTAPDPYIGPNQLTKDSINALVNNNELVATFFQQLAYFAYNKTIIGYGDLNGQIFVVTFDPSNGQVVVVGFPEWPSLTGFYNIAIIDTSTIYGTSLNINAIPNTLTYKNINGICYFSFPGCPLIFQHNNLSGAILTTYLGASFLSEMNGRLIAANVWQISGQVINYISPDTGLPNSSEVSVTGGTSGFTSAGFGSFPSVVVSGGQIVNLTVNISGGFATYPAMAAGCFGSAQFEYSKDGGVTWTTFYTWNATPSNFSLPAQNVTIPNITGVGNIDTLEVRVVLSVTAAAGDKSSIATGINSISVSLVTASSLVIHNYPYQYAWSAAQGQYGIFNPTTNDSSGNLIATGAGYNNLPDVEDVITGLFNTGPTQFVLRSQGITEVTALSSGINPFEFDHLWSSHKGIGTVFPESVGQYGSMGAFFSDTGIYTFGYEGINEIGGKATSAIYTDFITTCSANLIAGGLGPLFINGEVYLAYVLVAFDSNTNIIYVWVWNSKTKEWYRFQQQFPDGCVGLQVIGVNLGTIAQTQENSIFITAIAAGGNQSFTIALPIDGSTSTAVIGGLTVIPSNFVFCQEEIKIDRDVTINGVVVYYNCYQEVGELIGTFYVNGIAFESLDIVNNNVIFDGTWRRVLLSPPADSGLPYTGKNPQLTITAALTGTTALTLAKFRLGKVVLLGSVDVSQEPGNE